MTLEMNILILSCTLLLMKLFCSFTGVDGACNDYISVEEKGFYKRRTTYIRSFGDLVLCDQFVVSNRWYRFGDNKIPEYCPVSLPYKCGTTVAIWMNGSHPTDNVPVQVEACSSYDGNCCLWSNSIQVQRCENTTSSGTFFYVYQLAPVTDCESAYCLDIICPSGQVTHHTLVVCVDMYPDVGRVTLAWLGDEGDRRVTCSLTGSDIKEGAMYEAKIAVDDRVTGDYVAINDTVTFNVAVNENSQRITCLVRSYWRFSPQSKSSETASNVLNILHTTTTSTTTSSRTTSVSTRSTTTYHTTTTTPITSTPIIPTTTPIFIPPTTTYPFTSSTPKPSTTTSPTTTSPTTTSPTTTFPTTTSPTTTSPTTTSPTTTSPTTTSPTTTFFSATSRITTSSTMTTINTPSRPGPSTASFTVMTSSKSTPEVATSRSTSLSAISSISQPGGTGGTSQPFSPTASSAAASDTGSPATGDPAGSTTEPPASPPKDGGGFSVEKHVPAIVVPAAFFIIVIIIFPVCYVRIVKRKEKDVENRASAAGRASDETNIPTTYTYINSKGGMIAESSNDSTASVQTNAQETSDHDRQTTASSESTKSSDRSKYNGTCKSYLSLVSNVSSHPYDKLNYQIPETQSTSNSSLRRIVIPEQ